MLPLPGVAEGERLSSIIGAMHVGTAKVMLRLPENDNLKGKRRYVHSITSRLRSKFSDG